MLSFAKVFDLAGGKPLEDEANGPAQRTRILVLAVLGSVAAAAAYGLAVGSTSVGLAVGDLFKVPMVLILSMLAAVPAAMLCWKLFGATYKCTDLLLGLASGNFTASLVLATIAPLVALYYHTSSSLGGTLAIGSLLAAVGVGMFTLIRGVTMRVPRDTSIVSIVVPVTAMAAMQLLTLVQLISVASPMLPQMTVFDGGLDAVIGL